MKLPTIFRIAVAVVFSVCLAFAIQRFLSKRFNERPLTEHARTFAEAVDRGDSGTILDYAFPEERDKSQLNRNKIAYLLDLYRTETPKSVKWKEWSYQVSDKDQICLMDRLGTETGSVHKYGISFTMHRTLEGPKVLIVASLVFGAARNGNFSSNDQYPAQERDSLAVLRGLKRLSNELSSRGLNGTIDDSELNKMITWSTWISFWTEQIQKKGITVPN